MKKKKLFKEFGSEITLDNCSEIYSKMFSYFCSYDSFVLIGRDSLTEDLNFAGLEIHEFSFRLIFTYGQSHDQYYGEIYPYSPEWIRLADPPLDPYYVFVKAYGNYFHMTYKYSRGGEQITSRLFLLGI